MLRVSLREDTSTPEIECQSTVVMERLYDVEWVNVATGRERVMRYGTPERESSTLCIRSSEIMVLGV